MTSRGLKQVPCAGENEAAYPGSGLDCLIGQLGLGLGWAPRLSWGFPMGLGCPTGLGFDELGTKKPGGQTPPSHNLFVNRNEGVNC